MIYHYVYCSLHNFFYYTFTFLCTGLLLIGYSQLYKLLLYLAGSSITQCFSFTWTFLTDLYLQLVFLDHGIFLHSFHLLYFTLLWQARTIERELVKVSAQACVVRNIIGLSHDLSAPFSLPCSIWFCSLLVIHTGHWPMNTDRIKNKASHLFEENKTT